MKNSLYRLYDSDNNLLYIGVSHNPINRLYTHSLKSPWIYDVYSITIEWFDNREDAMNAEELAIKCEIPRYNKCHIQQIFKETNKTNSNNAYEIEYNVPIPLDIRQSRYSIEDLEINQSYFINGKTSSGISGSIGHIKKKYPDRKFKCKTYSDGVRVWRIE